ncbi:hypothetical protein F511_07073 [Dorcoceras hygrometricum]|nr:hypothetical protein F511_07073 [Dorcoceras hygrometricum]
MSTLFVDQLLKSAYASRSLQNTRPALTNQLSPIRTAFTPASSEQISYNIRSPQTRFLLLETNTLLHKEPDLYNIQPKTTRGNANTGKQISHENQTIHITTRPDLTRNIRTKIWTIPTRADRHSVKAPWVWPSRKRVVPDSRDAPRRMGSPQSTDRRSSPQPLQYHVTGCKSTNDRRKDLGAKSGDVLRQSGYNDAHKSLKRGVNRRDRTGSFWDLSDPDLGWNMGKTLIGDHNVLHLLPQPTE